MTRVLDLLIKGDPEQAAEAARAHGIGPLEVIRRNERENLTVARVPGFFKEAVESWLSEIKRHPYPIGTLLTFSERVPVE